MSSLGLRKLCLYSETCRSVQIFPIEPRVGWRLAWCSRLHPSWLLVSRGRMMRLINLDVILTKLIRLWISHLALPPIHTSPYESASLLRVVPGVLLIPMLKLHHRPWKRTGTPCDPVALCLSTKPVPDGPHFWKTNAVYLHFSSWGYNWELHYGIGSTKLLF